MSHDIQDQPATLDHLFTDHQWQDFRKEDTKAGGAVVSLMLGIFLIGIVLYSIVAITL